MIRITISALAILFLSILVYDKTDSWEATAAVATALTTFAVTYITLTERRISRLEALKKEIDEKIYTTLRGQLELFLRIENHTVEEIQTDALPIRWSWEELKRAYGFLASSIQEKTRADLERFTEIFISYTFCFRQLMKELKQAIVSEIQKINPAIEADVYLYMEIFARTEKHGYRFLMLRNLFLPFEIKTALAKFKTENKIEVPLKCTFMDGSRSTIHIIESDEGVVTFFEKILELLRSKSTNYKELIRLREESMKLGKQLLQQISIV